MLNQDLRAGKFRYMPIDESENPREWALTYKKCPMRVFGEDSMCNDCPDGCPLRYPDDVKNVFDSGNDGDEVAHERTRAERRHNDYRKAIRKRRIAREIYSVGAGNETPDNPSRTTKYQNSLHRYSKNKLHGSRSDTDDCFAKSDSRTNHRNGKKNWKPSDLRKIEEMRGRETEYHSDTEE